MRMRRGTIFFKALAELRTQFSMGGGQVEARGNPYSALASAAMRSHVRGWKAVCDGRRHRCRPTTHQSP
jgi:hypothetical protein